MSKETGRKRPNCTSAVARLSHADVGVAGERSEASGTLTYNSFVGSGIDDFYVYTITPVPEPSTHGMALAGLACGGWSVWRRRKWA